MECRVLIIGAYPDSVADFRGDLIRACVDADCQVTVMTAATSPEVEKGIRNLGVDFRPYEIKRNSIDIASDRQTLAELRRTFAELQPDIILAYTIKPIIWGGIAARRFPQTKFFALVTGLGYAFQGGSLKRILLGKVVTWLYWFALKQANGVIFQNSDNREEFVKRRIVSADKCHVVNGSGINLSEFEQTPMPDGAPRFMLIARLLGEKGIREYATAAEIVKQQFPEAIFELVGPEDPSPDGLPVDEVQRWASEGTVVYSGATNDVRPYISSCHIYVLPSYHEGMPRTVLEAMSMGRPILTTDVSGCKETVEQGVNGFLVPSRDVEALAERMTWFIENRDQWQTMGDASRRMAEDKFDVQKVNEKMLEILG